MKRKLCHQHKDVTFQEDVEPKNKSHLHNSAPTQYLSDDSDSKSNNEKVPGLVSRYNDDLSTDSNNSMLMPAPKRFQPLCMQGRHLKDEMLMTENSSAAISPTTNNNMDPIPGKIEIRINVCHVIPQNELERQMLIEIEEDEAAEIGGSMELSKLPNMICISGCNLNSIKSSNLQSQLQHSLYLNKDIQCYSKNNANFMNSKVQQQFHEGAKRSYQFSKSTWGISQAISDSDFKAEGTGIVTRASCSTRVKKEERDKLGRWTYQILDGKGERNVLIMSVYQ